MEVERRNAMHYFTHLALYNKDEEHVDILLIRQNFLSHYKIVDDYVKDGMLVIQLV